MKHAFTLIELLVVMALIMLLAAMLLPALSRSKSAAHRVACINNSRQLNLATQLYVDEHQDVIGYSDDFYFSYKETIQPYLGRNAGSLADDKVFVCPSDDFPMA